MVTLRDGKKITGVLRSWDQFGAPPPPSIPTNSRASQLTRGAKATSSSPPRTSASSRPAPDLDRKRESGTREEETRGSTSTRTYRRACTSYVGRTSR